MSNYENTQLTNTSNYKTTRMIFSEPLSGSIPDSKPKIEFKRINISTKNEDGTVGELIIPTGRLFSFGVSENRSQETGVVNGYTFPICLWNKDGPSKEERDWTDTFDNIVNNCINHLVEHRDDIDMFELTKNDLVKSKGGLNPLYWKKEKVVENGKTVLKVVEGTGPTIYTKLIFSKKNNKFVSQFFNKDDEPLDPLEQMGKLCYSTSAIKIESIFIGSRISLQVKLYESVIEPVSSGVKRLLSRPKVNSKVLEHKNNQYNMPLLKENSDDDSDGSLVDEEEEKPVPKPATKVVRKVVRKVVKK